MTIRTSDNKGRIHISEKGVPYSMTESDDGTIILTPIQIPKPAKMERQDMQAVYVRAGGNSATPSTVTIHATFDSLVSLSDYVVHLASEFDLPVVAEGTGVGGALVDQIARSGVEVISLLP